jgi:hypothetical protein
MNNSVLRNWVMGLPLRAQGTLLVAMRGCDVRAKFPLDSPDKNLVAAIRYAVCVPADEREVDSEPGCFMQSEPPMDFKPAMIEHYPCHYVMHLFHAVEVLGYLHPSKTYRPKWHTLYLRFCKAFHVEPEDYFTMTRRLTEDRIANNSVVLSPDDNVRCSNG